MEDPAFDVAVLGGAFDPPHVGHLMMGAAALAVGFARKIWLVPSPDRPDKQMSQSFETRMRWIDRCLEHIKTPVRQCFEVSTFERDLGVFRGSLFLMQRLGEQYPAKTFAFLMGQDVLGRVSTWNDPVRDVMTGAEFLATIPTLVFGRGGPSVAAERSTGVGSSLTPCAAGSRVVGNVDHMAAQHDLFKVLGWGLPPPGYSCAGLSSTMVRRELAEGCPHVEFLRWALGAALAAELCPSQG